MKISHHRIALILLLTLVLAGTGGCTRSARVKRAMRAADSDFNAGNYDAAELEYKKVHSLDRANLVALGQLGRLYVKEGRNLDALKYLSTAAKLMSNSLSVQLALAQVQASYHDTTNAANIALRILSAQPTNQEALYLLVDNAGPPAAVEKKVRSIPGIGENPGYLAAMGMLALRQQRFAEGEKQLRQAAAANSSQAYLVLAELYAFQKREKEGADALQKAAELAPLRSPNRIKYAEYLIRSGAGEQGRKMLEDLTDKAPDYIPGWVARMNLALADKKFDDASRYADTILAREPKNFEASLGRGHISMGRGDPTNAVIYLERMVADYKHNAPAWYELGMAYLMAHDNAKSVQSLQSALELDPVFEQAALLLGQVQIRTGDPAGAVESLTRFLKKAPNVAQAKLLLADAYIAEQRSDSAMAIYHDLAREFPKNPQIPLLMGIVMAGQQRNADASSYLEKSLSLAPDYMPAVEQYINLQINEGQYASASTLAQAHIARNPTVGELWELQAKIDIAQTNLARAESDLSKAIELNPTLSRAYMLLAQVYVGSGKYREALQKLNALVARNNDTSAYLQIGAIHEKLKEFDAAAKTFEKVISIDPKSAAAYNDLAYLDAVELNQLDNGYALAQKARELEPNSPNVNDTLGWILVKKGDYTHALALLQDSAERAPADGEIQYHLGVAHYMSDDEDAARVALQRAVASPRDYQDKASARRELDVLDLAASSSGASALADLEKALQSNPDDPVLLSRIAGLQEQQGAAEKAASIYEKALKQNPQSVRVMAKLARLYAWRLNQPEKALPLATAAHKLAPDNAGVSSILGHLVLRNGDSVWALSLLENAAIRQPNQPQLLYDLAWAYYAGGRIADAQTTMQKALQTGVAFAESDDARQFLTLADAYTTLASAQAASGQAQKILQADAKYVPALMVSGVVNEAAGDSKAAQENYNKALEAFPQFVPAARQLALLDAKYFKNDAKGYAAAEKARAAYPDDPAVGASLGILGYNQAKYDRSAEVLQASVSKDKDKGELLYWLGLDYYQLKRSKESKQALEKALAFKLPDSLAADARQKLAELK